ncbi:MAG: hypothetical protein AB1689_02885 [Thermodesulfobacteriota bacterium]
MMPSRTRPPGTIAALALALALASPQPAPALTAEEVLKLKEAGVSDETIQQMLANERAQADQSAATEQMQQQKFANDHIGTWTTSDGRVVMSTGRADPQKDVFDPTIPQSGGEYPMSVYPYVFPGAPGPPGPVLGPHGPLPGGLGPR